MVFSLIFTLWDPPLLNPLPFIACGIGQSGELIETLDYLNLLLCLLG
jgi:hypothetical protein